MLDRSLFLRPVAHRGLHNRAEGRIENTAPAFTAAVRRGYGVECDLRPAADGTPVVFHDATLDRLIEGSGRVASLTTSDLAQLRYKGQDTPILTYAGLLDLVAGAVPLLVEIKSEWDPPDRSFLGRIADLSLTYKGPLALMSFDPGVMAVMGELAPHLPRGIVAGVYQGEHWWPGKIGPERAFALSHLLESRPAAPSFYAYHVDDLPTPVTRFAREVMGIPLFTWTVRTHEQRRRAETYADAMIFEDFEP